MRCGEQRVPCHARIDLADIRPPPPFGAQERLFRELQLWVVGGDECRTVAVQHSNTSTFAENFAAFRGETVADAQDRRSQRARLKQRLAASLVRNSSLVVEVGGGYQSLAEYLGRRGGAAPRARRRL